MQNNQNSLYITKPNVINMRSELLFRDAEDDFYYFNKINSALKKLKKAMELTPNHLKSMIMSADIYFIKGNFKKALNLYFNAQAINNNYKSLAGIANCCYSLGKYENALNYVDLALDLLRNENLFLFSQLIELKIKALTELKEYKKAYDLYSQTKIYLDENSVKSIYSNYELIKEKLNLHKRLNEVKLKIV